MTIRFYLIPIEINGDARGPKYFAWLRDPDPPALIDTPWSMMDYGLVNTALIATDVTQPQHNTLSTQSDVTSIPTNIDNNITSGALSAVQSALEGLNIPGNWVTTSNTYREVLRVVAGLFQFAQRHHGLHNKIVLPNENNMNQTWGDLSLTVRQELQQTADSFGYDYSGVNASTPIRVILKNLADQWGDTPFDMGLVVL